MSAQLKGYNGWRNYETWNVALWLDNDEGVYRAAREIVRASSKPIRGVRAERIVRELMPDGTPDFNSGAKAYSRVHWPSIAEHLREMGE